MRGFSGDIIIIKMFAKIIHKHAPLNIARVCMLSLYLLLVHHGDLALRRYVSDYLTARHGSRSARLLLLSTSCSRRSAPLLLISTLLGGRRNRRLGNARFRWGDRRGLRRTLRRTRPHVLDLAQLRHRTAGVTALRTAGSRPLSSTLFALAAFSVV